MYPAVGLRLLPAAQGTGLPVVCFIVPVVIRVCAALRSSRIPAGQTGHGVGFRTFIRRVLTDALAGMVALLHRHCAGQPCGRCVKRYFACLVIAHISLCFCNGYIILVIGVPCCKHIFQRDRRIIVYSYGNYSAKGSAGEDCCSVSLH